MGLCPGDENIGKLSLATDGDNGPAGMGSCEMLTFAAAQKGFLLLHLGRPLLIRLFRSEDLSTQVSQDHLCL
jgi:hypothetical protein